MGCVSGVQSERETRRVEWFNTVFNTMCYLVELLKQAPVSHIRPHNVSLVRVEQRFSNQS